VRCPTCKREIAWSDEFPHRPFCSDRCRLIDLGAWLSEKHSIPDTDTALTDGTAHGDAPGEN
jgi:endogenous inhibitor of DNA gyrase (YacG/DUF329 family)